MIENKQQLVEMLQSDLKNERKHMLFYLQASVMVQGLHREELSELLFKEAQDEFKHVQEFSKLIVQLDEVPGQEVLPFPTDLACPHDILKYARDMEQEVADTYAHRLEALENMPGKGVKTYLELFYEDQLQDSQATALELNQYLRPYLNDNGF